MNWLDILLISIGLAMDCFAVSLAQGLGADDDLCGNNITPKPFSMAVLFGVFQGLMPLIGYLAGNTFSSFFSKYAPWIALALLLFIGGKMIIEKFYETHPEIKDFYDFKVEDFKLIDYEYEPLEEKIPVAI